jgi:hypothetical protein
MSSNIRGYIRPRGGKLEAVIIVPGRSRPVTKATGLDIGREEEAREALASALAEAATSDALVGSDITVRAWGEKWTDGRAHKASSKDEASLLRHHLYPLLGHVPLESVTKAMMLDWVRSLAGRVSQRTGERISARTIHHLADVTKRCLGEAADRDLLAVNPCAWRAKRDLPPKRDVDSSKREDDAFAVAEVARLISDPALPLWRRVAYAGLFLGGPRPGELLVRRWNDLDESWTPLPLLRAFTGWSSKLWKEGPTKTGARKYLPVHPAWRALLSEWRAEGWAHHVGRAPQARGLHPRQRGREGRGGLEPQPLVQGRRRAPGPAKRPIRIRLPGHLHLAVPGRRRRRAGREAHHPPFAARGVRLVRAEAGALAPLLRRRPGDPAPARRSPLFRGVAAVSHAAGAKIENACRSEELQAFRGMGAAGFEPATPAV